MKIINIYKTIRKYYKAFTFIEVIICITIISILSITALSLSENSIRLLKEIELKATLRTVRNAIDRYYEKSLQLNPDKPDNLHYPKSLEELVEKRFLRSLPIDPFTLKSDFKIISSTDELDAQVTNGENVYDIKSTSDYIALDGTKVSEW